MKTIFILDAYSSQSLTIAAMLKEHNKEIDIYGVISNKTRKYLSKNYDAIIYQNDFADGIHRDDLIIPTCAITTKIFLEKKDIVIGKITLSKKNLIVYDKIAFLELADKIGIPTPVIWKKIDDIPDSEYPIFYKQNEEKGGGIRGVVKKKKDIPLTNISELIFQEYINSQGTYGVGFIAHDGDILCSFTHFERESIPKQGGSAVLIESYENQRLIDYTKSLLKIISYSGWGLAEYKYCKKKNDFVLMEINSKFWASCEFAFRNNPIFFKLLFDVDIKCEKIEKMVYLDRALERGIIFCVLNIRYILSSKIRCQILSLRHLIILIVPKFVFKIVKRLLIPIRRHSRAIGL